MPNRNARTRRVSRRQLDVLWGFFNSHRDIAIAYNRSLQAKEYSKRKWREIAEALNAQGDGTHKEWNEWSKYWVDYKAKLKKRVSVLRSAQSATGGGPSTEQPLTEIDLKFLQILGDDFGQGLPGVREEMFSENIRSTITLSEPISMRDPLKQETQEPLQEPQEVEPLELGKEATAHSSSSSPGVTPPPASAALTESIDPLIILLKKEILEAPLQEPPEGVPLQHGAEATENSSSSTPGFSPPPAPSPASAALSESIDPLIVILKKEILEAPLQEPPEGVPLQHGAEATENSSSSTPGFSPPPAPSPASAALSESIDPLIVILKKEILEAPLQEPPEGVPLQHGAEATEHSSSSTPGVSPPPAPSPASAALSESIDPLIVLLKKEILEAPLQEPLEGVPLQHGAEATEHSSSSTPGVSPPPAPSPASTARSQRRRRLRREPPMSLETARRALVESSRLRAEASVRSSHALENIMNTLQRIEREDFTLQLLAKFKSKLKGIKEKTQKEEGGEGTSKEEERDASGNEEDDLNSDNWLGHKLRFEDKRPVLAKDASTKGDDWFDIYDPRNPLNQRKREKGRKQKKEI